MRLKTRTPGPSGRVLTALLLAAVLAVAMLAPGCGAGKVAQPASSASAPSSAVESASAQQGPSFSFIVCGDPQNNYEVFDRVLAAARSVDFLLIAGDLTGSGTNTEFQNFTEHMKASGVRYYCVPGNHDVATYPVQQGYAAHLGPPHHSFDYKNCHFIMIDNSTPELGFYPAEQAWAKQDLAAARKKKPDHLIAVAHVPPGFPYSAKASASQIPGLDNNHQLVPVLAAGGVKRLYCGHVHAYLEDRDQGVLVTVVGSAGGPPLGGNEAYGYVRVDINGRQLTQTMVRI